MASQDPDFRSRDEETVCNSLLTPAGSGLHPPPRLISPLEPPEPAFCFQALLRHRRGGIGAGIHQVGDLQPGGAIGGTAAPSPVVELRPSVILTCSGKPENPNRSKRVNLS